MTVIYLLRHAAYENPQGVFHGRLPGFPLSATGHTQARTLARILAETPISAVYSSPLTRTRETAQYLADPRGLSVISDERLMEIRSPLEGLAIPAMDQLGWNFYRSGFLTLGGESMREIYRRMESFLREITVRHEGGTVAAVSHADPIMCVRVKCQRQRLTVRTVHAADYVPQAGGYRLTFSDEGRVVSLVPISLGLSGDV